MVFSVLCETKQVLERTVWWKKCNGGKVSLYWIRLLVPFIGILSLFLFLFSIFLFSFLFIPPLSLVIPLPPLCTRFWHSHSVKSLWIRGSKKERKKKIWKLSQKSKNKKCWRREKNLSSLSFKCWLTASRNKWKNL